MIRKERLEKAARLAAQAQRQLTAGKVNVGELVSEKGGRRVEVSDDSGSDDENDAVTRKEPVAAVIATKEGTFGAGVPKMGFKENNAAAEARRQTEKLSPNPIFNFMERTDITRIEGSLSKDRIVTPTLAMMMISERNKIDKNRQIFTEKVRIIDVRSQSDIASHVIGGRTNVVVRGAVIYPYERMAVQHRMMVEKLVDEGEDKEGSARVEVDTERPSIDEYEYEDMEEEEDPTSTFKFPLTDRVVLDPSTTILLSCTDGKLSLLAFDLLTKVFGSRGGDFRVIAGGVRKWKEENCPILMVGGGDISSDSDDEDDKQKRE